MYFIVRVELPEFNNVNCKVQLLYSSLDLRICEDIMECQDYMSTDQLLVYLVNSKEMLLYKFLISLGEKIEFWSQSDKTKDKISFNLLSDQLKESLKVFEDIELSDMGEDTEIIKEAVIQRYRDMTGGHGCSSGHLNPLYNIDSVLGFKIDFDRLY